MLSTKHSNIDLVDTRKRKKKKHDNFDKIIKPSCVIEYNTGMGGVDKQDQMLACFPVMRKCMKVYTHTKKAYLIDMDIFNSHVLNSKVNFETKTSIV